MRVALGASRGQLVRQLLTEAVLLSLLGGVVGLAAGSLATDMVASIKVPTDLPIILDFRVDGRVIAFTFGVSLLAGIVFGLVPALKATRASLTSALKGETAAAGAGSGGRLFTLSNSLVMLQVAVSLVLLVAAGLFLRGIRGAQTIDPGFKVTNRLAASFNPGLIGYTDARSTDFYRRLLDRLRDQPGISRATLAAYVPLDFTSGMGDVKVEGRPTQGGQDQIQVMSSLVDADYFTAMGTPIRQGRAFTTRDVIGSLPVAIVNETFARRMWPGQSPLGKRIQYQPNTPWLEVVGVAADGKYRQLLEQPMPYLFRAFWQFPPTRATVVVEHQGDVAAALAAVRREVKSLDPAMPVFDTKTMGQFMDRSMLGPRLSAMLSVPTGILAALIAAIGLYGVMAYSVSRRIRELGIRVAVGAAPGQILGLVMKQGLRLAGVGMAVGLLLSFLAGRVVANMLFRVSPTDPVVYVLVPALLAAVSGLACWVPARRAVKVDPLTALRME